MTMTRTRALDSVESDATLPAEADVVIIGAGIAGTSAAWHLAKKGHSVALLEKGVVAGEQSSRNWGWCRVQNRDEREIPIMQHSMELWGRLPQELGADMGFRRKGVIWVTKDPKQLATWEAWINMAQKYQVQTRMMTAEEAREKTPGTNEPWIGGVLSPNDGRAEPAMAVPALARGARALGVQIFQNCAVRGLDLQAGRVAGVFTEKGRIRTQRVLLAGGAWASMFCRRHGVDLPQTSAHSTVFTTEPCPQVSPGALATTDFLLTPLLDGGYLVAHKARGRIEITPQGIRYSKQFRKLLRERWGSVTFGIGRSFFQGPGAWAPKWSFDAETPFERMRVADPTPNARIVEPAFREIGEAYPALKGMKLARIWAGWIDSTPDAIPVISGVPAIPGFFLSTGYSGHGFGIGLGAGRLAADLVAGDAPIVDPIAFRYERLVDGSRIDRIGDF